jgi:hypothetical protein
MAKQKAKWFVRRSLDDAILGTDGRWYKKLADVGDIKLYSSCGRAQKYGITRIGRHRQVHAGGNSYLVGSCHAVYSEQSLDCCGNIYDADGKMVTRFNLRSRLRKAAK